MGYHYSIPVVTEWVSVCKGWERTSGKDSVPGGWGGIPPITWGANPIRGRPLPPWGGSTTAIFHHRCRFTWLPKFSELLRDTREGFGQPNRHVFRGRWLDFDCSASLYPGTRVNYSASFGSFLAFSMKTVAAATSGGTWTDTRRL